MSCLYAARSLFIPKSTAWCVIRRTIAAEASSSATNEIKMPPASPSEEKSFSPKLQKIVDDIQQLTLIEASDLNELLRQRLNIKDVPIAAAPVAQAAKVTSLIVYLYVDDLFSNCKIFFSSPLMVGKNKVRPK